MISRLFKMMCTVKLFHWQTSKYAIHKETDEYFHKYIEKMDELMEVYLGIYNTKKLHLSNDIMIQIPNQTKETFVKELDLFQFFLKNIKEDNMGFIQVRDEIISLNERFKYLLTFE